ncbi:MAG TPA: Hsp70 family protein, partial [Candidatus Binatia bacterium]
EDRKRREEIEARNTADSMAYQVERQVSELGDRVPMNERARAEQLISQIRELVESNSTDVTRLRQLTSDLQQVGYGLAAAASGHDNTGGQGPGGGPSTSGGNDDVIDAEFKET